MDKAKDTPSISSCKVLNTGGWKVPQQLHIKHVSNSSLYLRHCLVTSWPVSVEEALAFLSTRCVKFVSFACVPAPCPIGGFAG